MKQYEKDFSFSCLVCTFRNGFSEENAPKPKQMVDRTEADVAHNADDVVLVAIVLGTFCTAEFGATNNTVINY